MKTLVILVFSIGLSAPEAAANTSGEIFECSELANWAELGGARYQLAQLGYERAKEDAPTAIDLLAKSTAPSPSFTRERSTEFWAGMWYGESITRVENWLQKQYPVQARPGASASERVMTAMTQQQVWKPIAAAEFQQRGCEFYLPNKD
ncbi:hypothetical protein [Rhizobium jaguaris]|uniref:Uncharacterized protein n=1 Tax=Rhizobium jaguaris TaxID=1312183 RepID=A0A387G3D1_9HYPH|nr:hypothetical protein [Rhizobium jaguaris]AYG64347.1 hypothetical protein CCGE525_36965 [Rhizobium jaguaris]